MPLKPFVLLLCICMCLLKPAFSQPRNDLPAYDDVLEHFLGLYNVGSLGLDSLELYFARKPAGWFIQLENAKTKTLRFEQALWYARAGGWQKLDLDTIPIEQVSENYRYESSFAGDSTFFALNLYYGYRGWETDVIHELSPKAAALQPTALYQLARAYSSRAKNTIWPRLVYQYDYLRYDSTLNPSDISKATLAAVEKDADSAIYYYRTLLRKAPHFTTFVGNVQTAWSNEYLSVYLLLSIANQKEAAAKYLPDNLYDTFSINFYRNVLLSCAPNTLLVTGGDNDTYVLTYLQEHFGMRRDVVLVQGSFLMLGRYMHYLSNILPEGLRLKTTLEKEAYLPAARSYIYLPGEAERYTRAADFVQYVQRSWTSGEAALNTPTLPIELSFEAVQHGNSTVEFSWPAVKTPYVTPDMLFFIDLFSANRFERPFAFVYPAFNLENHVRQQGLIYEVRENGAALSTLDSSDAQSFKDLMYRFKYNMLDSFSKQNATVVNLVDYYSYAFSTLAARYVDGGQKEKAVQLIDRYFSLFPDKVIPFSRRTVYPVYLYYQAKAFAKGDRQIELLAKRAQKNLLENLRYNGFKIEKIQENVGIINRVMEMVKMANRPAAFVSKLAAIQQAMQKAYESF